MNDNAKKTREMWIGHYILIYRYITDRVQPPWIVYRVKSWVLVSQYISLQISSTEGENHMSDTEEEVDDVAGQQLSIKKLKHSLCLHIKEESKQNNFNIEYCQAYKMIA